MNRATASSLILTTLLLALQAAGQAGTLRKIWEVSLDPLIKEAPASEAPGSHTVNVIRFSPDEQKLAVVAGLHPLNVSFASHLLILETQSPHTVDQQFELRQGMFPGDEYPASASLLWSPDGDSVASPETIFPLGSDRPCSPTDVWSADVRGYLNPQLLLGRVVPDRYDRKNPTSRLILFTPRCQSQDSWDVSEAWLVEDVSSDRGIALVQQLFKHRVRPTEPQGVTLVVDLAHKQVLRNWSPDELLPKQVVFADGAKAVCAAGGIQKEKDVPIRCFDADTGALIGQAADVERGWSIVAATQSSRLVINQFRPWKAPATTVLDRRVVWDFRTGQQIATWRPEVQKWRYPAGTIRHWRSNPYVFAISPSGKYIAEGGNGVLRLYEIEL